MNITQQKLPPKHLLKDLDTTTLNSIIGNFEKYIRDSSVLHNAEQYSIMSVKQFLNFWETISSQDSLKLLKIYIIG